jgi:geranylgeranyl pyrophosphate synthase
MSSNIADLQQQINYYFHNNYITKYPLVIQDMLVHLFNDGKRLRPILFIAFNHIANLPTSSSVVDNLLIEYAIEIELLHCLSLVIDDLPEMDNEVERRGKPCFHIIYGIQKTNFFLYYMFSKLSSNLTNLLDFHKKNNFGINTKIFDDAIFLIHYLINNLIDGQYIDITSNKLMSSDLQNLIDSNIIMVMKMILSIYNENNGFGVNTIDVGTGIENNKSQDNIILENHIILNIKKTGTLFALPIITGFLFQLYKKNLEYTGKEVIHYEFYIPNIENIENNNKNNCIDSSVNDSAESDDYDICKNKLDFGDDNMVNLIILWASFLGFLYQTSDDFLDMDADSSNKKPNICNILGLENSIKLLSRCTLIVRAMFDYIIKNTLQIWPDVVINTENVNKVIELIESRYNKKI